MPRGLIEKDGGTYTPEDLHLLISALVEAFREAGLQPSDDRAAAMANAMLQAFDLGERDSNRLREIALRASKG